MLQRIGLAWLWQSVVTGTGGTTIATHEKTKKKKKETAQRDLSAFLCGLCGYDI